MFFFIVLAPGLIIMSHFDNNNHLSQYQHGFRLKHSCESLVKPNVPVLHKMTMTTLKMVKAFDKVDHNKYIYIYIYI